MDLIKTDLYSALSQLAADLNLDPNELYRYTHEDHIGGFNLDVNERRWKTGSIWEVEGQILFALVRAMKPMHVIEIGTWAGCGASHILEAMALNNKGALTSIDIDAKAGYAIPTSLRSRWEFVHMAGEHYLASEPTIPVDIVFEDASHLLKETTELLTCIRDNVKPRLCISHDGAHFLVGFNIQTSYQRVFGEEPHTLLVEPSDCGFAYVVKND